jgi:hypothetical protein
MKNLFVVFTENAQKKLTEHAEKHAIGIATIKQTTIKTQNLLTNKIVPTQPVNDHRASAQIAAMTKSCDVLFDGQLENWPVFQNQLLNDGENYTIGWNNKLLNFQRMDNTTKPFIFLEGYFNIPDTMVDALKDDLTRTKQGDLQKPISQMYRIYSLRTKLRRCLAPDLAHEIEICMPTGISNKDGCIFFIKIVSHSFPDKETHKETHKEIIYEYTLKL